MRTFCLLKKFYELKADDLIKASKSNPINIGLLLEALGAEN